MQKKYASIRLLPVLLLVLFSMLSLMLVLSGAGVYKHVVDNARRNNEIRASLSYVSNKVRAADGSTVRVEKKGDLSALVMTESIDSVPYETIIYVYNGSLCELFSRQGRTFHPENGTEITHVSAFEAKLTDNLLSLRVAGKDGQTFETKLSVRHS